MQGTLLGDKRPSDQDFVLHARSNRDAINNLSRLQSGPRIDLIKKIIWIL